MVLTSADIPGIISELTLEEKVQLLSGSGFRFSGSAPRLDVHPLKLCGGPTDARGEHVFDLQTSAVFPNATCLASTFDVDSIREIGVGLGAEARLRKLQSLLAPTLNLHRDPRGGRNQESYGEDPFLAGKCGAALVSGIQSQGMGACIKHLVCNDSETDRRWYDVQISERALREIYLRPFEIVVRETDVWAIMTAYNKVNGISCAQNAKLLSIVREEWQFPGLFMSDWFGVYDGPESIRAGLDLEMPFPAARGRKLLEAIRDGSLAESQLDARIAKVLAYMARNPAPPYEQRKPEELSPAPPTQRSAINRKVAAEGIVLLQNDGILPISPDSQGKPPSVAIVGSFAVDRVLSHLVNPSYLVTPLAGFRSAVESLYPSVQVDFAHGIDTHRIVPLLDSRFTEQVRFSYWNQGERSRSTGSHVAPASTEQYPHAMTAMLMRPIPGLDSKGDFEIEMETVFQVPMAGTYKMSVIACAHTQLHLDGALIYEFLPQKPMSVEHFLFFAHQYEQTFDIKLEVGRQYRLTAITGKQAQVGHEPVAQGLRIGLVIIRDRKTAIEEAVTLASQSDIAICFVGTNAEWEMEGVDRTDLQLPCGQEDLVREVIKANPNTIIVNQSGAAVDLRAASSARAVIHAHFCGQEAGNAIADILLGKVNPCGKASYSWISEACDCATFRNFPRDFGSKSLVYKEELCFGYRYHDREPNSRPLFPFGHGLSYTTFRWQACSVQKRVRSTGLFEAAITLQVMNIGSRAGKDVVQIYVAGPDTPSRPHKTLEAFAKTTLLASGEQQTVNMSIDQTALRHWSSTGQRWAVALGDYTVLFARSASDIVCSLTLSIDSGDV